jgi:membrane-anchored glycerophosphoryl diester phosphodiesterase (GDPDase)
MRSISAADSVSFAVQRTREFFFRPFAWGTYLKLGLVAIITEGIGSNLRSSTHGGKSAGHGPMVYSPFNIPHEWIAAIVAAILLAILLCLVIFYFVTRLRFAFLHCLIHSTKEIRPGWRLYRTQAMRFFWLNVKVGICYLLLVVLLALPFVPGFMRLVRETQQGGQPDVGLMLSLALPLIPVIFLLVLIGIASDVVLRDWMLPHFALEDATAGEAWNEVWDRIKAEKRQFSVYAVLRLILPGIALIALFVVLLLPGLMVAGSVAVIEYGIHSAFADSTGASALVGILLEAFFWVVTFGFALLASICLGGPLSTGVREYALIFYGGRYQALGDILYPPAAPERTQE